LRFLTRDLRGLSSFRPLEDEQLITSQKKSAEVSNAESAGLGELDHAISID
jgi:hypothetical protein